MNSALGFSTILPSFAVDHVIIGKNLVALSIAERLARIPNTTTLLLDTQPIHNATISTSKLAYRSVLPKLVSSNIIRDPFVKKLAVQGSELLIKRATSKGIPFIETGDIDVSPMENCNSILKCLINESERMHTLKDKSNIDKCLPNHVNWCKESGLINVRDLLNDLLSSVDHESSVEIIPHTTVENISRTTSKSTSYWDITCVDLDSAEVSSLQTRVVIDCEGVSDTTLEPTLENMDLIDTNATCDPVLLSTVGFSLACLANFPVPILHLNKEKPENKTSTYVELIPYIGETKGSYLMVQTAFEDALLESDEHVIDQCADLAKHVFPHLKEMQLKHDFSSFHSGLIHDETIKEKEPCLFSVSGLMQEDIQLTTSLSIGRHVEQLVRSATGTGRGGRSTSSVGSIDEWA